MEAPNRLPEYFQKNTSLSPAEIRQVCPYFKSQELKKGEYFIREGSPVTQLGYLQDGMMRIFTVDEKGDEVVRYFAVSDNFIIDQNGIYPGKPCRMYIQALTGCELRIISSGDIECLEQKIPHFELAIHQIGERTLVKIIKVLNILRIGNPTEQYHFLMSQIPDIGLSVPLKDIASFLGITQPSLSRIRKRIS
jgi:CRP-like cAMP-binding protein